MSYCRGHARSAKVSEGMLKVDLEGQRKILVGGHFMKGDKEERWVSSIRVKTYRRPNGPNMTPALGS